MAKDVADVLGTAIGRAAREAAKNVSTNARKRSHGNVVERMTDTVSERMDGAFSGSKGLAAGVGIATLVPLAAKGAGKLVRGIGGGDDEGGGDGGGPIQKVGDKLSGTVKGAVDDQVEKAGGAGGIAKEAGKSLLPGGGGKGKKKQGVPGVGKGRRMPFQWDIDIGVPVSTVYEQWTQFENWPKFMHRLQTVSQEDDKHVKFKTKIWGISKEFTAEIVEQSPEERIKWKVTEGLTHQGVVTFHELAPRLTRVEVSFDVEPGGMIEKAARGMRHVKRAARADLARFKAYVLMEAEESDSEGGESEEGEEKKSRNSSSSSSGNGRSRSSSGRSRSRSSSSRSPSATKGSSSGGQGQSSSGGQKRSSSSGQSSSGGQKRSSSSGQKRSSSRGQSSSGGQKQSSGGQKKQSSSGGRKRSSSSGRKQSSPSATKRSSSSGSSNGRSSSSRTRASSSSNGRSSNGRSSGQAKKRTGSRS